MAGCGGYISAFFDKASGDPRVGIAHIGLYATLLQMLLEQDFQQPITAYGASIMQKAKISSSATYHKLIRDLADFGYILYKPSFYKARASKIYLPAGRE